MASLAVLFCLFPPVSTYGILVPDGVKIEVLQRRKPKSRGVCLVVVVYRSGRRSAAFYQVVFKRKLSNVALAIEDSPRTLSITRPFPRK